MSLSDEDIMRIADSDECNPDKSGWGPKFDYIAFARAILAAAAREQEMSQLKIGDKIKDNDPRMRNRVLTVERIW